MPSNFEKTFTSFIKLLKVPVTQTSALGFLQSHPDEGSLLAYAETLERYNIENAGIRIDVDRFDELPTPFVAYLPQYGGTFALVKEIKDTTITWLDTQKGWQNSDKAEFLKPWQGIALLAETTEKSGEKEYGRKRKKEILESLRIPAILILTAFVIGTFSYSYFNRTPSGIYSLIFTLKIIGIIVSSLLLVRSIDIKNDLVNKLCNNGPKVNCQSILDSPSAQITAWLSWSDIGFIYFWASFIALIISASSGSLTTFLSLQWLFSIGAAFFAAYSLWYQGIKTKMWCTLCLVVVSVLLLELAALLAFSSFNLEFEWKGIVLILAGLFIPIVFLLLFKKPYKMALEQKVLKRKLDKVYSNPAYFEAIMKGQPVMPDIPQDMPTVIFGNPAAENTITIVSNPLCGPCAKMHLQLEELVEENPNVKCQVVFLSNEHQQDIGGLFVRKLLSLAPELQEKAIGEWYSRNDRNFGKWNERYSAFLELEETTNWQKMHNDWTNRAEVKATPTLFVNGKKKPENVGVKELGAMLALQKPAVLD